MAAAPLVAAAPLSLRAYCRAAPLDAHRTALICLLHGMAPNAPRFFPLLLLSLILPLISSLPRLLSSLPHLVCSLHLLWWSCVFVVVVVVACNDACTM